MHEQIFVMAGLSNNLQWSFPLPEVKFDATVPQTCKVRIEGPGIDAIKFKVSQHRQRVGKKIHKTQQNIFRQHTRRAE